MRASTSNSRLSCGFLDQKIRARHAFSRQLVATGRLPALYGESGSPLLAEVEKASVYLRTKCEAARLCLEAWPRGEGEGELHCL